MKFFVVFVVVAILRNAHGDEVAESVAPVDVANPTNPECDRICTMEYSPRCCLPDNGCGDYMNFGNECALDVYNCNNPSNTYYEYALSECERIGEPVADVPITPV